jgi:hypothetical protein
MSTHEQTNVKSLLQAALQKVCWKSEPPHRAEPRELKRPNQADAEQFVCLLNPRRDSCALDRLTSDWTRFSRAVAVVSLSPDQRESMSNHRLMIGVRRPTEPFDGLGLTTSAHDWWSVVFPTFPRFGRAEGL